MIVDVFAARVAGFVAHGYLLALEGEVVCCKRRENDGKYAETLGFETIPEPATASRTLTSSGFPFFAHQKAVLF